MQRKNYCALPFYNLNIDSDSMRPCCIIDQTEWDPFESKGRTLKDVWRSTQFEQVRESFRKDEQYPRCNICWKAEQTGVPSARQGYNSQLLDTLGLPETDSVDDLPKMIQWTVSNTCNFACRTCSLEYSTGWLRETRLLADENDRDAKERLQQHTKRRWDHERYGDVEKLFANCVWLEIMGGETLLTDELVPMLQKLITKGLSKQITLVITTNGSVGPTDEIASVLTQFKAMRLTFSIDAVTPDAFKYIRTGDFDQVSANITAWQHFDNIRLYVNPTISILNMWCLDDILKWANKTFGIGNIGHNWVTDPSYYAVPIMPDAMKQHIQDNSTYFHTQKFLPYMWSGKHNPGAWQEFLRRQKWLDESRQQPMKKYLPELYDLINKQKETTTWHSTLK